MLSSQLYIPLIVYYTHHTFHSSYVKFITHISVLTKMTVLEGWHSEVELTDSLSCLLVVLSEQAVLYCFQHREILQKYLHLSKNTFKAYICWKKKKLCFRYPGYGCCKFQDSIEHERKVAKKLANQGLLQKHVPPPSCNLLSIFDGELKPLMSAHTSRCPTVIFFWTPWCLSSQKMMDHYIRFAKENGKQVWIFYLLFQLHLFLL